MRVRDAVSNIRQYVGAKLVLAGMRVMGYSDMPDTAPEMDFDDEPEGPQPFPAVKLSETAIDMRTPVESLDIPTKPDAPRVLKGSARERFERSKRGEV